MESFDFSKIFWFFHFKDNAIKCLACLCIYVYKIYKSKWSLPRQKSLLLLLLVR